MSASKKLASTLANAAAGGATYVDDVFSTYLYTGNGSTQTITNGIDLSGEGGLVWIKNRSSAISHHVFDTERGFGTTYAYKLSTDNNNSESETADGLSSFNADGFSLGNSTKVNGSSDNYASWTFRKAPGFFDVVTYTGNGTAGRTVSHNLGCVPGMVIVKSRTNSGYNWMVYHKGTGATKALVLNDTAAAYTGTTYWNDTAPTSTEFTLGSANVGNASGGSFVAYLFADGDDADAQIFGTDGDQAVVKCGSYTGNGSSTGPEVNLGFEPQWLLVKNASASGGWQLMDTMRGLPVGAPDLRLEPHLSSVEASISSPGFVDPQPTGFQVTSTGTNMNGSGSTYIYIAIRRPHKPAESGTEVFATAFRDATEPAYNSGFPVDFELNAYTTGGNANYTGASARLIQGKNLVTSSTAAEVDNSTNQFDYMDGWNTAAAVSTTLLSYMFKRSPGFFDVVCYDGTGSAQNISHNLGVVPEMIICMKRTGTASTDKPVYHASLGNSTSLTINTSNSTTTANYWNSTTPTDSVFTVGDTYGNNGSTYTYIAYLFASQAGISKVGSYTGNGSSQTIDCGFSSGARFFLVKASSTTGDWHVFDTERGIVAGNDPYLELNTTNAEDTDEDAVDPVSSGVVVNETTGSNINTSGVTYIYLAIS